jgi:carboxylesterase
MSDPAAPFALGDGPDACLLLHGLTGAPSEVRPLGEALAKAGVRTVAPLLPGHGSSAEALHDVTRRDLEDAARRSFDELHGARRVFICGLSMGALLALRLAAQIDLRGAGLALLAPAIRFAGSTWLYVNVVGRLPMAPRMTIGKGARDIRAVRLEPAARDDARHPDGSYRSTSLRWGRELRLLSEEALAAAPAVRAPALLLHGGLDRTADPSSARILAGTLGSNRLSLRVYPNSGHVLPLDVDGPAVSAEVVSFFQGLEA